MKTGTPWLIIRRPNPKARIRLLCFPYAGGSDIIFRGWQDHLPSTIEVCVAQLPGRGARIAESPVTDLPVIVERAGAWATPLLDKPIAIFGHSMGALIGFEMARHLRRKHSIQPVHLFISAHCSPQTPPDRGDLDLNDADFTALLAKYNGTPKEVLAAPELMELMLPVIRADFAVARNYVYAPEPPLDCPITAFGGRLDETVSRACIEGWSEHTAAAFRVRILPGDHFFLNDGQSLLLEAIARDLRQHIAGVA